MRVRQPSGRIIREESQKLVDDARLGVEHHAPYLSHRHNRRDIGEECDGPEKRPAFDLRIQQYRQGERQCQRQGNVHGGI